MKVVVQRVSKASVEVDKKLINEINLGFLLLVGIKDGDDKLTVEKVARKIAGLRIFDDIDGKMNLSLNQVGGEVLSISQFTLYGDCKKGFRPSFVSAAKPDVAKELYEYFNECLRNNNVICKEGIFQAEMNINLINNGPITIIIDSNDL